VAELIAKRGSASAGSSTGCATGDLAARGMGLPNPVVHASARDRAVPRSELHCGDPTRVQAL